MVSLAGVLVLSTTTATAADACRDATTTGALVPLLDAVESAYARRDSASVAAHHATLLQTSRCLDEPLTPHLSARLHRASGLARFLTNDLDGAKRSFAAARVLEPRYELPPSLASDDPTHPLRTTWSAAPASGAAVVEVPKPEEGVGAVWFDGTPTHDRPADRPTWFQLVARDGTVGTTELLGVSSPLPAYVVPTPRRSDGATPMRRTAWWTGGAGVVGLIGAGAAGLYYRSQYAAGGCFDAGGRDLECPDSAVGSSVAHYETFLKPATVAGLSSLGVGITLGATSSVLFAVSGPPGAR